MVRMLWMPTPHQDKSEYEHLREEVQEFDGPQELVWGLDHRSFVQMGDVYAEIKRTVYCGYCDNPIAQKATLNVPVSNFVEEAPKEDLGATAMLECKCSTWFAAASPFSGSWHGIFAYRRPWDSDKRLAEVNKAVERIVASYPEPYNQSDEKEKK